MTKKINKICNYCKLEYFDYPQRRLKFCSKKCEGKSKIGQKRPPEVGRKIALAKMGIKRRSPVSLEERQKHRENALRLGLRPPSPKGRKASLETRIKLSLSKMGINNPQYKDGKTPINKRLRRSFRFFEWRTSVFERDNYTCQICDERGGTLHPNHIKKWSDYPELRFVIENGVTLCKTCHFNLVTRHEKEWENYFLKARNSTHG